MLHRVQRHLFRRAYIIKAFFNRRLQHLDVIVVRFHERLEEHLHARPFVGFVNPHKVLHCHVADVAQIVNLLALYSVSVPAHVPSLDEGLSHTLLEAAQDSFRLLVHQSIMSFDQGLNLKEARDQRRQVPELFRHPNVQVLQHCAGRVVSWTEQAPCEQGKRLYCLGDLLLDAVEVLLHRILISAAVEHLGRKLFGCFRFV
mmetsp:Transcript_57543/g.86864  ORF Transcript_57543/g.86864 Transcript_57543/m.86864 type:complete len:201 (-) Transcript_57543:74-676(-)